MTSRRLALTVAPAVLLLAACSQLRRPPAPAADAVRPALSTERVASDSDDPAIWIHPQDPSQSLILGTDKGGALYVFTLDGKIVRERTVTGLARPNNVDVEYGVDLDGVSTDLAVVTERDGGRVRVFRLPELAPLDGGGLEVFAGDPPHWRAPMGVALFKRRSDGATFAIVSRKTGPAEGYLWQYRLGGDGAGGARLTKVRQFGAFSGGQGEIEAIAVDDALGWVYYSDEWKGIRKYAADPDAEDAGRELALFGTAGFREDREGISIYELDDTTGYLLISDQQANRFRVYPREGSGGDPHAHVEIASLAVSTLESDGSETTSVALGEGFPAGLFVAMSEGGTFQLYRWQDLAGDRLRQRAGRVFTRP